MDNDGKTLNVQESYTVTVTHGNSSEFAENASLGGARFWKPVDNIGHKSIPDYAGYASDFIYEMSIPGCKTPGP